MDNLKSWMAPIIAIVSTILLVGSSGCNENRKPMIMSSPYTLVDAAKLPQLSERGKDTTIYTAKCVPTVYKRTDCNTGEVQERTYDACGPMEASTYRLMGKSFDWVHWMDSLGIMYTQSQDGMSKPAKVDDAFYGNDGKESCLAKPVSTGEPNWNWLKWIIWLFLILLSVLGGLGLLMRAIRWSTSSGRTHTHHTTTSINRHENITHAITSDGAISVPTLPPGMILISWKPGMNVSINGDRHYPPAQG